MPKIKNIICKNDNWKIDEKYVIKIKDIHLSLRLRGTLLLDFLLESSDWLFLDPVRLLCGLHVFLVVAWVLLAVLAREIMDVLVRDTDFYLFFMISLLDMRLVWRDGTTADIAVTLGDWLVGDGL